ncbi:hypothetical protein MTO96_012407 [Rhipicephalus appendiculatus]
MASAMAENFRVCGWLCRAAGVFFIRNIQAADVDEMEVTWKSWYTLYSVACLSTLAATNIEFVATKMMELSTKARTFTKVLFLVVPVAVSSKVLVNIFSAIIGSGKMKEFLKNASKHEMETSFWRQRYRYRSRISYVLRFLMAAAFSVNIVVTAHMTMSTAEFGNSYYLDLLRVVTIIGIFPFFFYDMLYSMTLRPCCDVLIAYVRHQHATVRAVLPTVDHAIARPLGVTGVAELQRVKANLRSIGKLRQLLNDIWQYSLAVSSAAVLIVGCITVYCTFDNGMPLNQILLSLSYFVYSGLDFIDVARLSHAMADEAADVGEVEVTWKSWYTLYSVAFLSSFVGLFLHFAVNTVVELSTKTRTFTKALYLVVPLAAASKVTVNVCSVTFGSAKMKEFFRRASQYEMETSFWRQRYRYRSRTSYALRFFIAAACIADVVATAHITMSNTAFGDDPFLDFLTVATIVGNFVFFFYDMLQSITLRPCCEVLIAYVRHQHATVRAVLPSDDPAVVSPLGITGVAELQRVKENLRSIGKLRQLLNATWQYSLAVSSVAVLVIGCITIYCTFDRGMPPNQMLLCLAYFAYSSLDLIDMARLSHAMADEVSHLYVALRPEDMTLSGGNFFTLDLPLLVSSSVRLDDKRENRWASITLEALKTSYESVEDLVGVVIAMASAMAKNFRIYGWLCRAAGVFFIRNIQAADVDEMGVTWKSWYTFYSVVFLSSFGCILFEFAANAVMAVSTKTRTFHEGCVRRRPFSCSVKSHG